MSDETKGHATLLFTYSIGQDNKAHTYPHDLSCAVENGLWSKIGTSSEIVDSLSNYYQLFALGLGSDLNQDFDAWVEPYQFKTGNTWGTAVSVPVYDRSKTPHLFLGVAGIDVPLQALDAALASSSAPGTSSQQIRDESIRQIVQSSDASCLVELLLDDCQLQAFRILSAPNNQALCESANCTDEPA